MMAGGAAAPETPAATSAEPKDTMAATPPADAAPADKPPQAVAMAEPPKAPESAPPAEARPAAPAIVPTFDIVRVEPTGETVVAGLSEPDATVDILDGAAAVASAQANDRGEWALALDKALEPGSHDLAIRTTSKDRSISTLSDQRVAVSVPEPGSKDVLVVLNSPDKPSKIIQLPPAEPKPAEGPKVAAAEPPAAEPAKPPGEPAAVAAAPAQPEPPAASPATTPAKPEVAAAPQPQPAANAEPPKAVAAAPAAPAAPAKPAEPVKPAPEIAVTAVEADTAGMLFVAGTATTPEPVRVYLGDEVLGQANPSPSGTWLVEAHREVAPGTYQVRADQVAGGGAVVARAEVPFEREITVAALSASGSTGAGGGAQTSGKVGVETVIIKRGDNLWSIARDAWGRGIRWSTLYQANKDQIRNPHWIYPGQVFVMPATPDVAKD